MSPKKTSAHHPPTHGTHRAHGTPSNTTLAKPLTPTPDEQRQFKQFQKEHVYIQLTLDWAFKWFFGQEKHKRFLISFINAILPTHEANVIDLQYGNTEQFKKSELASKSIVDIFCITDKGTHLIIEIQTTKQRTYLQRALRYGVNCLHSQFIAKQGYRINPVYVISVLDALYFDDRTYHRLVTLVDTSTQKQLDDSLNFIYLELPKIAKNTVHLGKDLRQDWLYVIKYIQEEKEMPSIFKGSMFEGVYDEAKYLRMSPQEQFDYFRVHKKALYTAMDRQEEYERGIEEGLVKGLAEGEEKGLVKGLLEGKKAGLAEGEEKGLVKGLAEGKQAASLQIARKMKAQHLPVETIADYTGLSIDDIRRL